ncbi:hypothetical protein CALVIDRAFT_504581 [Calocera viscosa TUFC12733]|uniref:SUN domain-containing protein n=1 Tax=Calocera viscosa (strain TUFC12733) TaxID=1330018 RepID=A0A167I3C3_CALVF|nr:hypothetical protein CALVIDRAFT_504581 [Calocera viscosa TUFC12733]
MRLSGFAPLLAIILQHGIVVRAEPSAPSGLAGCRLDPFHAFHTLTPTCLPSDIPTDYLAPNTTSDAPPPDAPPEPAAPTEDESSEFLSFEEWKARQIAQGVPTDSAKPGSAGQAADGTAPAPPAGVQEVLLAPPIFSPAQPPAAAATAGPRIAIPLNDRYNYASDDCSARVHASSKGTKNPSAILSRKKDRYMLHQCNAGEKWVEVELCDHIWVDTVQLANYEFFSGVFRNVSIYLSPRYPPGPEGWVHAGTFEARNVRAVQSFHPPPEIKGFHRFLRVEFENYYGAEFYCPVSLLRVYGLNEMEEWKRDAWEAEAEMREREAREREQTRLRMEWEESVKAAQVRETRTVDVLYVSTEEAKRTATRDENTSEAAHATSTPAAEIDKSESAAASTSGEGAETGPTSLWTSHVISSSTVASPPSSPTTPAKSEAANATPDTTGSATQEAQATASAAGEKDSARNGTLKDERVEAVVIEKVVGNGTVVDAVAQSAEQTSTKVADAAAGTSAAAQTTVDASKSASSQTAAAESSSESATSSSTTSSSTLTTPPQSSSSSLPTAQQSPSYTVSLVPPSIPTGESIYRTIMNRLTLLEVNTTLGTRYMEEQSRMMREAFKRLERGVEERWGEGRWREVAKGWEGKLDGLTAEQRHAFDTAVNELEQQRARMEIERKELVSQIHMLENEVVLEKRLSVAQLCLLIVVLFVMTLTRGPDWAAISTVFRPSLSHESRAATPARTGGTPSIGGLGEADIMLERRRWSSEASSLTPVRRSSIPFPSSPPHAPPRSPNPASPRSSRFYHSSHPSHPSLPFRTSSHSFTGTASPRRRATGGPGTIPGSAKRLARTAHLHELRKGKENVLFGSVDESPVQRDRSHSRGRSISQDDLWEDTDVDDLAGVQLQVPIVDGGPKSAQDLRGIVRQDVLLDEPPDTAAF